SSRVLNRTGVFVFYLGDRYFGTLTAVVPGPEAARYEFTSAIATQVLKNLLPELKPELFPDGIPAPIPASGGPAAAGVAAEEVAPAELPGRQVEKADGPTSQADPGAGGQRPMDSVPLAEPGILLPPVVP
ncbi:MAG: hypothetical protein ABI661_13135, partial [Gammaproteobacteria bacterium]